MRRTKGRWAGRLGAAAALTAALFIPAAPAVAHPLSTSAVLLDVDPDRVSATVELPLDELSIARNQSLTPDTVVEASTLTALRTYVREHLSATDSEARSWTTSLSGGRVKQVDGAETLVLDAALAPSTGAVGDFVLHYDAVIDLLPAHRVFVSGRYGHSGKYTTLAMLSWQTTAVEVAAAAPPSQQGFGSAVALGIEHIAGGSDHLLFLLMLLLPAPLVAGRGKWTRRSSAGLADVRRAALRVAHLITAFAIGHSCTLILGALGWIELPTRWVESGIALSVLVSALHAVRPLVRRGEVLIAGGFGLLHGLAFASLLGGLDLEESNFLVTLLGFNIGIELAQLIVVAMVMPSLMLLSRQPVYPVLQKGLALIGALLAAGWLAERVGLIGTNPLEPISDLLTEAPGLLAGGLALLAVVLYGFQRRPHHAVPRETPSQDRVTDQTQHQAPKPHRGGRSARRSDEATSSLASSTALSRPSGDGGQVRDALGAQNANSSW